MEHAQGRTSTRSFLHAALDWRALPAVLALGAFVTFAAREAGYPATVWYPGALFLLGLAAVSLSAQKSLLSLPPPALTSLALLGALTAWTYISIAWAEVKGDAWDGANRGLLYLVVYALFLGIALRQESVALLLAGYVVAITVLGLVEFVAASRSSHPDSYFLIARFSAPTGYQNANCALFSIAFWPALLLAARREVPVVLRAMMLGSAGVLVELALLSQSRGWLAAIPIVFLLYVAIVPQRVRLLAFVVPVALTVIAARGPILHVFPALRSGEAIHASLRSALDSILVSGGALFVVGAVLALVDRHFWPAGAIGTRLARAGAVLFGTAALGAAIAGLVWVGNPSSRLNHAWNQFKSKPQPAKAVTASYFSQGFGSNRYDLWRVATHEISRHPLLGVGSDNFAVDYLRERRSDEEPLYPHSIELKIEAQTGLVGGVFFAGLLLFAILAWARRPDPSVFSRSIRAGAFVAFAYWLLHGSIDWFWETPGLAAPAFGLLGLSVSTADPLSERATAPSPWRGRIATAVAIVALVAAAGSLVAPWLAAKDVQLAAHEWRIHPAQAFDRLDRARRLNPLSDQPDLIAGAIASRLGQTARMAAAYQRALARNPKNWYAHLELAVADVLRGKRRNAERELELARALDPREPAIPFVVARMRDHLPISTATLDRIFLLRSRTSNRVHP